MISSKLVYAPVKKPRIPNDIINVFLMIIVYECDPDSTWYVTSSIIDGKIRPSIDKHTAPIKEMNGPRSGTKAAIITATKINRNK